MVYPLDYEKADPAPSNEITMEDFLNRLECIRGKLWMEKGVFLPNNVLEFIYKNDIQKLLRFASLDEVAEVWGEGAPAKLAPIIYEKLNAFLDGITLFSTEALKECWKQSFEYMLRAPNFPRNPVEQCIQAVQSECDECELTKHYGVKAFPGHTYDWKAGEAGNHPDKSIVSILGLILFWFAALPCTEDAKQERTRYRKRLELKLNLLLAPESIAEFQGVYREAYDDMILNDAQNTRCPKNFQADEKQNNSLTNENSIDKGMSMGK